MNMQAAKLELIKMIADIQSEELIRKVKQFLKDAEKEAGQAEKEPSLSKEETTLLLKINEGLPEATQLRYNDLLKKLTTDRLSETERQEFLQLTALVEAKSAERLKNLLQLARLWNTTAEEVMDRLGIKPPPVIHA